MSTKKVMALMMMSTILTGCLSGLTPFGGVHVGSFDIDSLGKGTVETNDMIVELELIDSTSPIQFNDDTGAQDGGEHYRFRLVVGDDENGPTYECRIASDSPDDCLIVESVEDGVWTVNEKITLNENSVDICSEGCYIQLTIMNGDITTEQEENLQYLAHDPTVYHTTNFWTSS
tara:strand:+ start:877 stop:1398 length:522 start_codon:yes stop_codon:yes gene_type:complete